MEPSASAGATLRSWETASLFLPSCARARPSKASDFLNAEALLGRALAQLGRNKEAVSQLLKVAPADADGSIHFQLFKLYRKLGQEDKAKEALEAFEKIRS